MEDTNKKKAVSYHSNSHTSQISLKSIKTPTKSKIHFVGQHGLGYLKNARGSMDFLVRFPCSMKTKVNLVIN